MSLKKMSFLSNLKIYSPAILNSFLIRHKLSPLFFPLKHLSNFKTKIRMGAHSDFLTSETQTYVF